jgi:outer membrane receptor protein involved in Fe transport
VGSHEFQTGVFAQPRLSHENDNRYVNGGASFDELALVDPTSLSGPTYVFHHRVYDAASVVASSRLAQDYALYIQDGWRPSSRLTITAGVRADNVRVRDRVYNVDVQNSWSIGPRIGATYVLTSDEKNVVRANYGRVADLPQTAYLPTAGGPPIGQTDFYYNPDGTAVGVPLRTPPPTLQNSNQVVDPNRHQPFIDEWILGYRRQLPGRSASTPASFGATTKTVRPMLKSMGSTRVACSVASRTSTRTRFTR